MPRQKLTKAWVGHPKRPTCQATQKWSDCQMTKSKAIHTISHDFIPKNDHVNKKWHCCLCKISSSNKICSQFVQKTIFVVVWLSDCSHQTRHPPWLPETFLGGRPTSLTSGRNGHHGWNYVSQLHKFIYIWILVLHHRYRSLRIQMYVFLAVQDSSIGDLVTHSLSEWVSQVTFDFRH